LLACLLGVALTANGGWGLARFPIALRPEKVDETVLDLSLVWYTSNLNVLFVESLRIAVRRLEFAFEELLLTALVNVAASGGEQVTTHPKMDTPELGEANFAASRMYYFESLEISNTRVNIRLDLDGGREIADNDDSVSAAVRVYIPVLEVEALLLRFAGMSKAGLFVSGPELRRLLRRHYAVRACLAGWLAVCDSPDPRGCCRRLRRCKTRTSC
jgi:hypothetical protein